MGLSKRVMLVAFGIAAVAAGDAGGLCAAPSFDCRRASSIVEKEICGVGELGDLDRVVAQLFAQALAVLSAADAGALRAEQRDWLRARDECGDLVHGDPPVMADVYGCLRERMIGRAERLRAIIARRRFLK